MKGGGVKQTQYLGFAGVIQTPHVELLVVLLENCVVLAELLGTSTLCKEIQRSLCYQIFVHVGPYGVLDEVKSIHEVIVEIRHNFTASE